MTIKDLIYREIEKVGAENLDELYEVVKQFVDIKTAQPKKNVLSKLKQIKIQAPPDFAENLDLYLSGEKQTSDHSNLS